MNVMAKTLQVIRLQAKLATLRNNNPLCYEPNPTLPFKNSYFPADVSSSLVAAGFSGHADSEPLLQAPGRLWNQESCSEHSRLKLQVLLPVNRGRVLHLTFVAIQEPTGIPMIFQRLHISNTYTAWQ